jgi:hypothetical protein
MKQVFTAILLVVSAWAILSALCSGLGLLIRRTFGIRNIEPEDLLRAPWVGWCGLIAFLQLWHFFLPVDGLALAVLAGIGLAGVLWQAKSLLAVLRSHWQAATVFAVVMALAALWLANHAVNQPKWYDSGLYHLASIRWAHSFPVVPGLGNLHQRLAYNNSFFLYAALMDVGPMAHRCHQAASGLLILWMLGRCLWAAWKLFGRDEARPHRLFDALFLAPLLIWTVNSGYASSPSPDVGVFLLQWVIMSELIARLTRRAASRETADARGGAWDSQVATMVWLATTAVTIKITAAPFATVLLAVVLTVGLCEAADWRRRAIMLLGTAGVGIVAVVPWMIRGVLLSGYAMYPFALTGLPVDWKLPAALVRLDTGVNIAWARLPGAPTEQASGNWKWLLPWVNTLTQWSVFDVIVPTGLACAGIVLWLCNRKDRAGAKASLPWLVLLIPAVSLVFWFFSVPDPRFAGACFWILGIGTLTFSLWGMSRPTVKAVAVLVSALLLAGHVNLITFLHPWQRDPGLVKTVPLVARTTDSGLVVYVPAKGDQCWDAPLPNTPYFNSRLRLRVPGDMSKGFEVSPSR